MTSDVWTSETERCPDCGRFVRYGNLPFGDIAQRIRLECPCSAEKRAKVLERGCLIVLANTRRAVGLSKRTSRERFDNFIPDNGQQKALQVSRAFAEKYIARENNGSGLLLVGGVGSGKTHLAAAIVNDIIDHTPVPHNKAEQAGTVTGSDENVYTGMLFIGTVSLMEQLRAAYHGKPDGVDVIRRCKMAHLLVLDDLGAEKVSDWVQERLFEIIDHRYNEELPTIITSNETVDELRKRLGDRIVDRLRTMCQYVAIRTKSHRQTA